MPLDGWLRNHLDPRVTMVEAELRHIRMLVPVLRAEDRAEIYAMGTVPRHLLHRLVRSSPIRRTVFVDGDIAAMWGCGGSLLGIVGEIWLFTAAPVERVPLAFLKAARRGIDECMRTRRELASDVSADYERSIRFMRMLGFEVGHPYALPNGAMFRSLTMER